MQKFTIPVKQLDVHACNTLLLLSNIYRGTKSPGTGNETLLFVSLQPPNMETLLRTRSNMLPRGMWTFAVRQARRAKTVYSAARLMCKGTIPTTHLRGPRYKKKEYHRRRQRKITIERYRYRATEQEPLTISHP